MNLLTPSFYIPVDQLYVLWTVKKDVYDWKEYIPYAFRRRWYEHIELLFHLGVKHEMYEEMNYFLFRSKNVAGMVNHWKTTGQYRDISLIKNLIE